VAASAGDRIRGVALLNCAGGMNNKAISDDWRIKLAMPLFLLIDFLLSQPPVARYLFDRFRNPENVRQVLMVSPSGEVGEGVGERCEERWGGEEGKVKGEGELEGRWGRGRGRGRW
jgi:hypothetical protein